MRKFIWLAILGTTITCGWEAECILAATIDEQIVSAQAQIDSLKALQYTGGCFRTAARIDSALNDTLRTLGISVVADTKDSVWVQLRFAFTSQIDATKRALLRGARVEAEQNENGYPGQDKEHVRLRADRAVRVIETLKQLMR